MLDMGFEQDMETILGAIADKERQTLLFSATLPKWVKSVAKRWGGCGRIEVRSGRAKRRVCRWGGCAGWALTEAGGTVAAVLPCCRAAVRQSGSAAERRDGVAENVLVGKRGGGFWVRGGDGAVGKACRASGSM